MLGKLLTLFLNSKGAKGAIGGGSAVALVIAASAMIDTRIDKVKASTKIYVDLKHEKVMVEVKHLKEGQIDMKKMLRTIDRRLYNLNKPAPRRKDNDR